MSRTGLSPADIAESFRDRCGDGSVEWTYTPTQTWVLLDAADMLDENAKLRELVRDMFRDFANADNELKREQGRTFMAVTRYAPRMRELGVEV
ncbi:MAG: hypothetical protein IKG18_07025 [Atopobiaceae bacterium]|nr:hypothetical protein [Atopobiaceae bacterium]